MNYKTLDYNCPRGIGKTNWVLKIFLNNWKNRIRTFVFTRRESEKHRIIDGMLYKIPQELKKFIRNIQNRDSSGLGHPDVVIFDECEGINHHHNYSDCDIIKIYTDDNKGEEEIIISNYIEIIKKNKEVR